jgi:hypothetical protein
MIPRLPARRVEQDRARFPLPELGLEESRYRGLADGAATGSGVWLIVPLIASSAAGSLFVVTVSLRSRLIHKTEVWIQEGARHNSVSSASPCG